MQFYVHGANKQVADETATPLITASMAGPDVQFQWIPIFLGITRNAVADTLAASKHGAAIVTKNPFFTVECQSDL